MSEIKLVDKNSKEVKPKQKKDLNFEPHPNTIFAIEAKKGVTPSGIILPETSKPKTPICEILAIGENVSIYQKGDVVYVNPTYMQFAEIDGVDGVILMVDGIFGKIPKK